jgi:anti-anti-sigma factor
MGRIIERVAPVERCGLILRDPETGQLEFNYARGFDEATLREVETGASERNINWVMRNRTMIHVPDVERADHGPIPTIPGRGTRSKLHLPLLHHGECFGGLVLASGTPHYFNAQRLALLSFVSNLAAVVYANIRHTEQLGEQLALIRRQQEDLRVLSAPILDVGRGTLLLPIIGRLDAERAAHIQEVVLDAISRRRTGVVILDLTGMEAVDSAALEALTRIVRAMGLMGARCAISGITPSMAHAMVSLGIGFGDVDLFGTMESAIAPRADRPG